MNPLIGCYCTNSKVLRYKRINQVTMLLQTLMLRELNIIVLKKIFYFIFKSASISKYVNINIYISKYFQRISKPIFLILKKIKHSMIYFKYIFNSLYIFTSSGHYMNKIITIVQLCANSLDVRDRFNPSQITWTSFNTSLKTAPSYYVLIISTTSCWSGHALKLIIS